jgi:hypothetical protein
MTTVFATTQRTVRALLLAFAALLATVAAHAGPEVTFYLTVPLDGPSRGHVLGLRVDHNSATAAQSDIRNLNPSSPLARRPLLDLQFGKDSALRLELDRRLAWDINTQQWHDIERPATVTVRVPTHESSSTPAERAALAASVANPLADQVWKPLVKPVAIEP